VYETKIRSI